MKTLRQFFICALLLIVSCTTYAELNLADPIPINPQLKTGKLENGLTYYIQQNKKPAKRVELRLVIKAGSILEDDDQQGLAHLLEHMAFNGSTHFKKHELISYLQSLGIKFGADLNAYTSFDETVYILPIPVGSHNGKDNLETGFQVLEDWAHGLILKDADIDAERKIVLEEARLGKGAEDRMMRKLFPALFNGSKYAERLPIGKENIISTFKYDALTRFYKDWYRPDLMAVVVVGDVEPDYAGYLVHEHFSKIKNPENERPRVYAAISPRKNSESLVITDKEATDNEQMIQYPIHPSKDERLIADYRKSLVKNLSTAMLNQRLRELTQQTEPPFISGESATSPLVRGYESFASIAQVGRAGPQAAINALIYENERARQLGFSADELERAKKNLQRTIETAYNERNKSESVPLAEEYIRNFLTNEPIPGIVNEYTYVTELLPGITLDEVNSYTQQAIPDSSAAKLLAYLGSDKKGEQIPTETELSTWANQAEQRPVLATKNNAVAANLMAHPPKAGHIVSETKNKKLGITEFTLSNGVKVLIKPTDFKSDQILLSATRFGGQSLFDDADIMNARYSNAVVDSMGLATYTPTELQKILAGKSLQFQVASTNFTENLRGITAESDIESLFQLMHLRLNKPRIDADLFSSFIQRMEDSSKNNMEKPEAVLSDTVLTTLYNNNLRVPLMPKPEDFSHISMARAAAIFSDRYTSADGFTFILVGSIDLKKIKPLIATYLASIPTPAIARNYRDVHIRPVTGVVKKDVHSGSEDKSQVVLAFTGPAKYSKEESMRFNALVEVMNLRIIDILREKLNYIYSGKLIGSIERVPYENYRLHFSLPCSPENVDKLIAATFAEIEKMKTDGPTVEDLNKVKQNWLKSHAIDLRTNEYWLGYLQNATLYNTDPANVLTLEKRIQAVTQKDVQNAAARYFNTNNYVQVVLYPKE